MIQLLNKDKPLIKQKLLKKQKGLCKICKRDLYSLPSRDVCLDHDHYTNRVRAVLCRVCNSLEGKFNKTFIRYGARNKGIDYKEFLRGLIKFQDIKQTEYLYPVKKRKGGKNKKRKKGKTKSNKTTS